MAGLGSWTPRILAHLDDTPDFYLGNVAQVVMDRWSSGRIGLFGDAAFSPSPMSGQGTGLVLVGACLLAGELATAGWNPEAGFAAFEERMRPFVEANQEIGRMHVQSLEAPAGRRDEPDMEALMALVDRALNGIDLPDYAGLPDSRASATPDRRPRRPGRRATLRGRAVLRRAGPHTGPVARSLVGKRTRQVLLFAHVVVSLGWMGAGLANVVLAMTLGTPRTPESAGSATRRSAASTRSW